MPRERIPLRNTNKFKLDTCMDFLEKKEKGLPQRQYCRENSLDPATLRTWLRKLDRIKAAVDPGVDGNTRGRQSALTLGGSGRISATDPIEDALRQFVKDTRRDGHTVSRNAIVAEAKRLMPEALAGRSFDACLAWCSRMLRRSGLTIRRVTHSGRAAKADLEALRLEFVEELVAILTSNLIDPRLGLAPRRLVFNMDQTAMFASAGALTTVEVRGAKTVPVASGGGEMYRCTLAVTACSDGRILPPHFVFRGKSGGDVEAEITAFVDESVATFSVQAKAWFDERDMLEWVDKCWAYIVTEPCILILDSLTVHRSAVVASQLADMGTMVLYVPGGATSVGQPLDVGVMGPLKHHYRMAYAERHVHSPFATNAPERRREMFDLAMEALGRISPETVVNAFDKAGPYFPAGPALQ